MCPWAKRWTLKPGACYQKIMWNLCVLEITSVCINNSGVGGLDLSTGNRLDWVKWCRVYLHSPMLKGSQEQANSCLPPPPHPPLTVNSFFILLSNLAFCSSFFWGGGGPKVKLLRGRGESLTDSLRTQPTYTSSKALAVNQTVSMPCSILCFVSFYSRKCSSWMYLSLHFFCF